ncbi:MAG: hypothetical protein JWM36_1856 [Hyphomicrobiales bacterium]|nr:hypothetical protein [Hyphomicrobiales bacterium]
MILKLRSAALLGSVAIALTVPGLAQAASYDGKWAIVVVTEAGNCDVYRWDLGVNDGKIEERGFIAQAKGQIDPRGRVNVTFTSGSDALGATGTLSGADGSGRWTSPTKQCSGHWTAKKRA